MRRTALRRVDAGFVHAAACAPMVSKTGRDASVPDKAFIASICACGIDAPCQHKSCYGAAARGALRHALGERLVANS